MPEHYFQNKSVHFSLQETNVKTADTLKRYLLDPPSLALDPVTPSLMWGNFLPQLVLGGKSLQQMFYTPYL